MVRDIFPAPVVDPALVAENIELHKRGYFGGQSMRPHLRTIAVIAARLKCKTLLDYGSGKGELWQPSNRPQDLSALHVTLYDPAVVEYQTLPAQAFDGVICVDVLEHIPRAHVASTLDAIIARATKFVYLVICPRAGTKVLPFSGEDVHVTIRPPEWWRDKVSKHCSVPGVETQVHFSQ